MSKKPTLTIRYPEASEKALKLTEAMVKRSPGKRVVETESEDPIFPDGGDLFSSFIRCKTQTGVDLTLTLNPASMDYALETLIRPNLNADERKQILGEDVEQDQAELGLDGGARESEDSVPSLDKPGEKEQNYILREDITLTARLASLFAQIASTPKKEDIDRGFVPIVEDLIAYIDSIDTAGDRQPIVTMMLLKRLLTLASGTMKNTPKKRRPDYYTMADELTQIVGNEVKDEPSWDDVEKEARTIGQKSEPAGESDQDSDIEPGLLNDIEDQKEGEEK